LLPGPKGGDDDIERLNFGFVCPVGDLGVSNFAHSLRRGILVPSVALCGALAVLLRPKQTRILNAQILRDAFASEQDARFQTCKPTMRKAIL
jgi:hypothetical protein